MLSKVTQQKGWGRSLLKRTVNTFQQGGQGLFSFYRSLGLCRAAFFVLAVTFATACHDDEGSSPPGPGPTANPPEAVQIGPDRGELANSKADLLADLLDTRSLIDRLRVADRQQGEVAPEVRSLLASSLSDVLEQEARGIDAAFRRLRSVPVPDPEAGPEEFESELLAASKLNRETRERIQRIERLPSLATAYLELANSVAELSGQAPVLFHYPAGVFGEWSVFSPAEAARLSLEVGNWEQASSWYRSGLRWLESAWGDLDALRQERRSQFDELIVLARAALDDNRLTTPQDDNAAAWLAEASALYPEDPQLLELYDGILERYRALIRGALDEGRTQAARSFLNRVLALPVSDARRSQFQVFVEQAQQQAEADRASTLMAAAVDAGRSGDIDAVARQLERLRSTVPDDPRVRQIEQRYLVMLHQPGRIFDISVDDEDSSVEMIVGPRGRFTIGTEQPRFSLFGRRHQHEGPRHELDIAYPYAISRTEVTVGQYRQFVSETGYVTEAEEKGFSEVYSPVGVTRVVDRSWRHDWLGRLAPDQSPVIHISWRDAKAFADWLSQRSGEAFRLPSEAEFEVLARAGSGQAFLWDDDESPDPFTGNYFGSLDRPPVEWGRLDNSTWEPALQNYEDGAFGPAVAGRFTANEFGFHDLVGNVAEWVEDCAHSDHEGSRGDGRPRTDSGNCSERMVRGGSWISSTDMLRLAHRESRPLDSSDSATGFRIAMDFGKERISE